MDRGNTGRPPCAPARQCARRRARAHCRAARPSTRAALSQFIRERAERAPEGLSVVEMCVHADVPRATYYLHWQAHAPRVEETALRDAIQRLALADRHEGYRRLRAEGWAVNHQRLRRILCADNLLALRHKAFVPQTTDSHHPGTCVPTMRGA